MPKIRPSSDALLSCRQDWNEKQAVANLCKPCSSYLFLSDHGNTRLNSIDRCRVRLNIVHQLAEDSLGNTAKTKVLSRNVEDSNSSKTVLRHITHPSSFSLRLFSKGMNLSSFASLKMACRSAELTRNLQNGPPVLIDEEFQARIGTLCSAVPFLRFSCDNPFSDIAISAEK